MVAAFFTPEYVESRKPFIQAIVDKVFNQMTEKGCPEPVDLVENFSLPVPSIVSIEPPIGSANGSRSFTIFSESQLRTWNT